MNGHYFLTLFVVSALLATSSWGQLQCYRCNPCDDPFNPDAMGVDKEICTGTCTKLIGKDVRDCNPSATAVACDEVICTCDTDFCNNATFAPIICGGDSVVISMTTVVFVAASQIMLNLL